MQGGHAAFGGGGILGDERLEIAVEEDLHSLIDGDGGEVDQMVVFVKHAEEKRNDKSLKKKTR